MPATGSLMCTPASMSDSVEPQTLAIEEEPLLSMISDTRRSVYGKSFSSGTIGKRARSARAPWPMSRRLGPRMNPVSPTQYGGKL